MSDITKQVIEEKTKYNDNNDNLQISLFNKSTIHTSIQLPFNVVGKTIQEVLTTYIKQLYEGKCIKEGYVRPNSIKLIQFSSGICCGENILFHIVYQAMICYPIEGTKIVIEITNITKAGIRGKSRDPTSPIDVFIARDHNVLEDYINKYQIGDNIFVEIIGQRFEINDTSISIIAEIVENKSLLSIKDNN